MNSLHRTARFLLLSTLLIPLSSVLDSYAQETDSYRVLVLREGKTAHLMDGVFDFKLIRIRGYFVDVRVAGNRRTLKLKERVSAPNSKCTIIFTKISPETRLARFSTDCPGAS